MNDIKKQKEELLGLLKFHYGFEKFRLGQEKTIDSVLAGKSTLVVMPTGGGKSLCYQLPALVLEGVTIVISPLIALMKDQVDNLQRIGIPATFINSSISLADTKNRLDAVKAGEYKLLYIAPERFYSGDFVEALKEIKISLFAVDEAHCISQWGHDFRPSYLKMKDSIEMVGSPPVMALTATATPEVRDDIIKQLGLVDPELIVTGFARPNLQMGVIHAREARKAAHVLDAVTSAPDEAGIIYVSTRNRVDNLTQFLLENNIEAVSYHAGMDAEDRKWVQNNFMSGKAKVIVATNAFGLGIDKANIRYVIHYDMPGTVEAYYQEAGRAGRDGKPSFCLLLYNSRDRALHEFFIKGDNPPASIVREIYNLLLDYESDTILITYAEISDMLSDTVPDMAIGTSLKILEKEGYLSRSREKSGHAFLKLLSPYETVLESLGTRAKKSAEILEKMYAKYPNELKDGWPVNFEEVAEILGVKRESILRLVRKLADEEKLDYKPPFKGTEIKILKRVNARDLEFDEGAMRAKLRAAYKKLDKIEEYVYNYGCRQKYILDYFGDMNAKKCKRCDICLTGGALHDETERQAKKIAGRVLSGVGRGEINELEIEPPKPKSSLSTKLTQLETLDLYTQGMNIKEIAKERDLQEMTIENHLAYLIEKGIIKDIDKLVDSKTQKKIIAAIKKVGIDKLKPIYEELEEKIGYDKIKFTLAKYKKQNPV